MKSDDQAPMTCHKVNWVAVRMTAMVKGVREAARLHGVSEAAALKRSQREGWMRDPAAKAAALHAVKQRALPVVAEPSAEVMARAYVDEMNGLGQKSRLSIARGLNHAAREIETMPGRGLLDSAQNVKAIAAAAGKVHGWQDAAPRITLCLQAIAELEVELPEMGEALDGPASDGGQAEWSRSL